MRPAQHILSMWGRRARGGHTSSCWFMLGVEQAAQSATCFAFFACAPASRKAPSTASATAEAFSAAATTASPTAATAPRPPPPQPLRVRRRRNRRRNRRVRLRPTARSHRLQRLRIHHLPCGRPKTRAVLQLGEIELVGADQRPDHHAGEHAQQQLRGPRHRISKGG
jgi:hypothetical protein